MEIEGRERQRPVLIRGKRREGKIRVMARAVSTHNFLSRGENRSQWWQPRYRKGLLGLKGTYRGVNLPWSMPHINSLAGTTGSN